MPFYTDYPVYPTEILNLTDYPLQVDNINDVLAVLVNALRDEVIAIQTELGTLPSGASATVKARLDALGTPSKIQDADADTLWNTEETADKDEIVGKVKGVEFFRGHADGIITTAKQSAARGYRATTNQSLPSGVTTKVQLNGEAYDIQGEFDPVTNYRFTAKKAGIYNVSACVYFKSVTNNNILKVYVKVNGTEVLFSVTTAATDNRDQARIVCGNLQLAVDSYVELFAAQNSGVNKDLEKTKTTMSICKIA